MKTVRMYLLKAGTVERFKSEILAFVSRERVEKASRFVREEERLLSLGAAYLMQRFAGQTVCDGKGKPRSDSVSFNVSHSRDLIGIALCDGAEIGLDIEKQVSKPDGLVEYCLSDQEKGAYEQGVPFLDLYVSKESLGKAEGSGLLPGIREIPALPLDGPVEYAGRVFYRHSVMLEGYFASVTLEKSDFGIRTEWLDAPNMEF